MFPELYIFYYMKSGDAMNTNAQSPSTHSGNQIVEKSWKNRFIHEKSYGKGREADSKEIIHKKKV